MKRVSGKNTAIITGACGTIGLALSKHLMAMGVDVIGVGRSDHAEFFSSLIKQYPSSKFVGGDLLDGAFLMNVLKEFREDPTHIFVFHLAGQSDVKQCEADPLSAFQQNTLGTVNVLEACVKNRISRFIFSSTSYVYGDGYQENITEAFDVHPAGIYPLSKIASEVIIKGYAKKNKISCDIVRIANVYGPDFKTGTVLETMMSQSKQTGKIVLKSFSPVRDFIYIEDVSEALSRLMVADEPGCRIFNLSMGQGISMGELAELFCDVKGLSQKIILAPIDPVLNSSRLVLDNQALTERLQWHPTITLRDGLNRIFKIQDEIGHNGKT